MGRLEQLFSELKRRRVFRALLAWGIFALAALQVVEPLMHGLGLPDWTLKGAIWTLAAGFPITAALSWLYDLTSKGVTRTPPADTQLAATVERPPSPRPATPAVRPDAAEGDRPGPLSVLIQELAQAPGETLLTAWRSEPRPGERIGRFEVRREIGRGGFGAVYEAQDGELGRLVAVKALRPHRTGKELSADWIKKEAEAVARLDHPCIVTLFDVGTSAAGPYLVMELLRGQTLAQRIAQGPLPTEEAVQVAKQMARGLAHAHRRGILHRDLKPANVFLCEDGRVKLLDFGLAHLLGKGGSLGSGTPGYMPPEQARGDEIDARADVYAAAMTLREMLTGKRDPDAGPVGPRALSRALERALSANREDRPRDGTAWLEEIRAVQAALDRPRKVRRVAAVVTGSLLLGAVVAGLVVQRRSSASLQRLAGGPDGRITVAVADFANETRDPDFDGLSGLLMNSLEQSKKLRVLTRSRMWDHVRELGKDTTGRIDETLAREVGRKASARALLLASIRMIGTQFVVEMRALDPERDEYLFTTTERAADKSAVLDVVDRLSQRTRLELKEQPTDLTGSQAKVADVVTRNLEANAHYFRAQQIMAETLDSERAREEYLRAIALDPDFAMAHLQLAILMVLGEAAEDELDAAGHLAVVTRLGARVPERERRLAELLAALVGAETADAASRKRIALLFQDALAAHPDSKELLAMAGQRAVEDDDYDLAVQRLEAALRIDPGYGPALVWLSTAYDKLNRKADAVSAARRAVSARPGPVTYAVLAQALAVAGERDAAVAAVGRVYTSGSSVPYYVSEMVWPVHAYAGDWKGAEAELRRWIGPEALPDRRVMSWSALSFLLNAQGRVREVRALAGRLREAKQSRLATWAEAMADMQEGKLEGARRALRAGGGAEAATAVAWLGDLEGAAVLARELPSGSTPSSIYRAVDVWKRGRPREAVPILRDALSRNEEGAAIRYLGEILCEGEDPVEGAALLARWLARYPSAVNLGMFIFRPRVLLQRAACLERQGLRPEARETVERFLSDWAGADPGLPLLAEARAMQARLADPAR